MKAIIPHKLLNKLVFGHEQDHYDTPDSHPLPASDLVLDNTKASYFDDDLQLICVDEDELLGFLEDTKARFHSGHYARRTGWFNVFHRLERSLAESKGRKIELGMNGGLYEAKDTTTGNSCFGMTMYTALQGIIDHAESDSYLCPHALHRGLVQVAIPFSELLCPDGPALTLLSDDGYMLVQYDQAAVNEASATLRHYPDMKHIILNCEIKASEGDVDWQFAAIGVTRYGIFFEVTNGNIGDVYRCNDLPAPAEYED